MKDKRPTENQKAKQLAVSGAVGAVLLVGVGVFFEIMSYELPRKSALESVERLEAAQRGTTPLRVLEGTAVSWRGRLLGAQSIGYEIQHAVPSGALVVQFERYYHDGIQKGPSQAGYRMELSQAVPFLLEQSAPKATLPVLAGRAIATSGCEVPGAATDTRLSVVSDRQHVSVLGELSPGAAGGFQGDITLHCGGVADWLAARRSLVNEQEKAANLVIGFPLLFVLTLALSGLLLVWSGYKWISAPIEIRLR